MDTKKGRLPAEEIALQLREAGLPLEAEAFGAEQEGDHGETCAAGDFIGRVLCIAAITGDKLLEERARQRLKHPELLTPLSPIIATALDIYCERFYSFWQAGELITIRSEMTDFPQWHNGARRRAEKILTSQAMENILAISCRKDQSQRAPLLEKLLYSAIDSETIRMGYLYPERREAHEILGEFLEKLAELLQLHEQHDSSLQTGDHPEGLIPHVWANIIKNLLNGRISEALDNVNALSYLHYAAQRTESTITGTDAYAILKRELALFRDGAQCTWPQEVRKMFLDPTMVEILNRYRFTHGLIALNGALAFLRAEGRKKLDPWDEDAIVLNGMILTQEGYIRSSGFSDGPVREQFLRDIHRFQELRKVIARGDRYFLWKEGIRARREGLASRLEAARRRVEGLIQGSREAVQQGEEGLERLEMERAPRSFFARMRSQGQEAEREAMIEERRREVGLHREVLAGLEEMGGLWEEMAAFLKEGSIL